MSAAPSFHDLLAVEYRQRFAKNPSYSLRAFARDIDVSAAFLSQILRGKRRLSEDRAEQIADHLGWSRRSRDRFLKFVRAELTARPSTRARLLKEAGKLDGKSRRFEAIPMDHFQMISEWYHFSILELSRIPKFDFKVSSIAKRLGISETTTAAAIDRLKEKGLLRPDLNGRLRKSLENYSTGNIPSAAIRNFHKQMARKAIAAIGSQAPVDRDISGITMAVDTDKLPIAKKMIAEFRRELMATLESGDNPTAIYHFSAQLFRIDQEIP